VPPQPTRVVGYVRVSTEQQVEDGVSLEAQKKKLDAYAVALDLELVDVIEDAGLSAKSLHRPGLARALGLLDAGDADGLVVTKLDRLTRSVRDLGDLVDRYFASRFSLLSVSDAIDTRTASGRLVLHVLAAVSQWEREATAERTRDALAQLRAEGLQLGGEGLGWRRSDQRDERGHRTLERLGDEADTIDRIRQLDAEGHSLREIAAVLETEDRRTKRGGRWHPTTILRLLARKDPQGLS
jgi:DNA invertase Pin-like site-specific DNA recombinase